MALIARLFLFVIAAAGLAFLIIEWRKDHPPFVMAEKIPSTLEKPKQVDRLAAPPVHMGVPAEISEEKKAALRDVGAGLILPPEEEPTTLERVDPLPQPTPPPAVQPLKDKKIQGFSRWRSVKKSVVTSAGIIQTGNYELILPGIDVVSEGEWCKLDNGKTWPCGKVARTALRGLINGKALTCKLPDVPEGDSFEAECYLRGRDLSLWLVTNGWAHASANGPYENEGAQAKQNRRGIYGDPERGVATVDP